MKQLILLFIGVVLVVSCKKKKPAAGDADASFEKATLLENVGKNCIIPAYDDLNNSLADFQLRYNAFVVDQSTTNFNLVREAWKKTYISWQSALIYEFGPGMDKLLQAYVGTFPSDTTKIKANCSSGSYDLNLVAHLTAQGIPAFDFLCYRPNAISYFNQANYAQYGKDLILKMKTDVSTVLQQWNAGYVETFKSSAGTESTSSFSVFVNQFVKSFEQTKWAKVGIPLGKQSLGVRQPDFIEAKYAGVGLELLSANLKASKRLFNGDQFNGTKGVGFDDYLIALKKQDLVNSINATYDEIIADIAALNPSFENALNSNPQALDAIYTKIQNLTVYLKTDMTAAFGVLITYQDNDGD